MSLILTDESLDLAEPALTDRDTIRRFVRHVPARAFMHWRTSTCVNKAGEGMLREW